MESLCLKKQNIVTVKNLPKYATEDDVRKLLLPYGKIREITNVSRGMLVRFKTKKSCYKTVFENLNGCHINNNLIVLYVPLAQDCLCEECSNIIKSNGRFLEPPYPSWGWNIQGGFWEEASEFINLVAKKDITHDGWN